MYPACLGKHLSKSSFFYVLVHANLIPCWHPARWEVERIKREENYIEILGNPLITAKGLARDKIIRVCGAYKSLCVEDQLVALQKAGYHAVLYREATIHFLYSVT